MAGYTIGSDKGRAIADGLKAGESYSASDGSTWQKNADGTVSVTTKNGGYTANAYQSSAPAAAPAAKTDYTPSKSDAGANSNMWRQAQTDTSLTAAERKSIQDALHSANEAIYGSGASYNSTTGTWAPKASAGGTNYAPSSTDASANSALWLQAQNDTSLTPEQRKSIQDALHAANEAINSGKATYDPTTGKWTTDGTSKTVSVRRKDGTMADATVTYDALGNVVNVLYSNGTALQAGDTLMGDNGSYTYYDEKDGWKTTDLRGYNAYLGQSGGLVYMPKYDPSIWSNYEEYLWDVYPAEMEARQAEIDAEWAAIQDAKIDANQAATEQGVLDLQHALDQSIYDLNEQKQVAANLKEINEQNVALQNAAAGDLGGMGQKQYTATQANYDSQYYSLVKEEESLRNNINSEIAKLKAEGQFELATTLAELGEAKLQMLAEQLATYDSNRINLAMGIDDLTTTRSEQAIANALNKLQLGLFSPEDAEALGVPPEDAKNVANYYSELASIDLDMAKAQLNAALNPVSTGGRGGGYGGGGGSDTPNSKTDPLGYLYAMGATDAGTAYALLAGGSNYTAEEAAAIADYYESTYYPGKKNSEVEAAKATMYDMLQSGQIKITNNYGPNWIQLATITADNQYAGNAEKVSWQELDSLIKQGKVYGVKNASGSYTYYYRVLNAPKNDSPVLPPTTPTPAAPTVDLTIQNNHGPR